MRQTVKQAQLHFRFTEKDFLLDEPEGVISETLQPWKEKFEADKWKAVYEVGFEAKPDWVDVAGSFLYLLADMFQKQLTRQPDLELSREKTEVLLDGDTVERLLNSVPFTLGSECVTENWLKNAFRNLQNIFAEEISNYEGKVSLYLTEKSQHLRAPERIFFHLVESEKDDYPFAFLATYATKDENGKVRHMPLRYALTEHGTQREKLLELLSCLNRAAESSSLIGEFVERGELFHPLRLTAEEAYQILKDVPKIEETGIVCRIPNWALMCKHVAAVLYGIGARFDENPLLFFELRGIEVGRFVDVTLANHVESMLENANAPSERIICDEHWEELFGVI